MALASCTLNLMLAWELSRTNTGYQATRQGRDSKSFNLADIDLADFDQIYAATFSIANGASQVIDLTSLTNLVYESVSMAHALAILVKTATGPVTLEPDATNGLEWFLGGTSPTITVPAGGVLLFSEPAAGPGRVVDGSNKRLKLTNNGGGPTSAVDVVIVGGTT